jgi:hypothetical protein
VRIRQKQRWLCVPKKEPAARHQPTASERWPVRATPNPHPSFGHGGPDRVGMTECPTQIMAFAGRPTGDDPELVRSGVAAMWLA